MPDENGNPIPGEPGHYRYEKDKAIKSSGVTGMGAIKKAKEKEPTPATPVGEIVYTKETAFKLNRETQEKVLTERKVEFSSIDKEKNMVNKILKSNPKE